MDNFMENNYIGLKNLTKGIKHANVFSDTKKQRLRWGIKDVA